MFIKEKLIFWVLLVIFAGGVVFGFYALSAKKEATQEFLDDIEKAAQEAKAKSKVQKGIVDMSMIEKKDDLADYSSLIERSIFNKAGAVKEDAAGGEEVISLPVEEEKPQPKFVYKGKMSIGNKDMAIIEDKTTGKSYSVKEGDLVADCVVASIGGKEVVLKKKDGEEIIISTLKKEGAEEKSGETKK